LALLAALVTAAATLAGCGRKGSLDLPPTAAVSNPQQPGPSPSLGEQSDSPTHAFVTPPPAPEAPPPPPPTTKRWFPLDFLLN
jgi:predicted small lipoprotein YifL